MFDWITRTALQNRILTVAAYVVVLVVGVLALQKIHLDVFPEFAPPQVVIQTESPGLAAEDVERLITFPMETAVNRTPLSPASHESTVARPGFRASSVRTWVTHGAQEKIQFGLASLSLVANGV